MFTWIPIHREAIHRILEYRERENELLAILYEMEQQGLKVISLQDENAEGKTIPLAEIDPFTFLATFNRGLTDKNRRENWNFLKARWNLQAPLPDDFTGIPTFHPLSSWLFMNAPKREKDHVKHLWQIASLAADGDIEQLDEKLFDHCLKMAHVGIGSLTVGLFWINPEKFLPTDKKTTAYGKANGIRTEPEDYQRYRQWMKEMTERFGQDYPRISHAAHLFATQGQPKLGPTGTKDDGGLFGRPKVPLAHQYWTLSAGHEGEHWEEFYNKGIISIGWEGTPDLRQFKDKREIRQKLLEIKPGDSSKTNAALACWQFVHDVRKGDIIFAKQGSTKLLGYGVVEGDYAFDPQRPYHKHVRKIRWLAKGEWKVPEDSRMALKTLTNITPYHDFVSLISKVVGLIQTQ